ncbi:hypothetical protein [Haliangium sp.]|uniref:hypothetical protein n=1 Tax=Haliangium sp. TaxID=2663208 RepID=UPI003D1138C6
MDDSTFTSPAMLPAIVIGVAKGRTRTRRGANQPRWLRAWEHQVGGPSCTPFCVHGCALPLAANLDRGLQSFGPLVRAFARLGESGSDAPGSGGTDEAEIANLAESISTISHRGSGQEFTPPDLLDTDRLLARYLRVPLVYDGIEGALTFAPCDPLEYFGGWRLWRAKERSYDIEVDRRLRALDPNAPDRVRVFLLWENSD